MSDTPFSDTPFSRYRPIIDDWEAFQAALDRPLPICVWANPLKTSPEKLEALFEQEDISYRRLTWRPGAYRLVETERPGNRLAMLAGLYQIQEEVSMLPVQFFDLRPGQRILDACAAPGNKTAQIATTLANSGTVIANDRSFRRMRPLGRTLDRLGISNTALMVADAASLPDALGSFDAILADVPCSCEGTSRKKNTPASEANAADFEKLCGVQRAILRRALQLCRPGGRVIYSTCTYAPEENEAVVDRVLDEFGEEFELLPARIAGFPASSGLVEWQGKRFDQGLNNALRVYPHQHDTGGFFLAVLQHRGL